MALSGLPPDAPSIATSDMRAAFAARDGRTSLRRLHEAGALRLRHPRMRPAGLAEAWEGIVLNTGGGILGGDGLALAFDLDPGADVVLTTVAAEKIYRAAHDAARLATCLTLAPRARLAWLPQETILFDRARLDRSLTVTMAADATLLAAEMLVFGRLAMGETAIVGSLRDSWRVSRGDRLIFADETRMEGDLAAILDRPALGDGARAVALILYGAPDAEARLDAVRAALAPFAAVQAGASAFEGLLVVRLLARSPEVLRGAMVVALTLIGGRAPPRVWQ